MEPLVVVTLLFGGTWVNRNTKYRVFDRRREHSSSRSTSPDSSVGSGHSSPRSSASLLESYRASSPSLLSEQVPYWRKREIRVLGFRSEVVSPNTRRFEGYFLSRLLQKFPFLVEAWYWALIYWVRLSQCGHHLELGYLLYAGISAWTCLYSSYSCGRDCRRGSQPCSNNHPY
jgi:hypothetical protein